MTDSPKAEKGDEEANIPDATPAANENASEEVSIDEAESTEEVKPRKKETGEKSKKGYSQRVRTLVKERNEAEARARSLEEKLAELTAPSELPVIGQQKEPPDDSPIVAPGEEIDVNELDRRIKAREQKILQQADAAAQLRARQSEAIVRINNEASEVIKKYPELDPENEVFDRDLSESITEATESYVRANPYTASVKNFVAKQMKPYQRAVEKEVGKATEQMAKQAREAALKPTSVRKGEKTAAEKTIAELEQELGIVVS